MFSHRGLSLRHAKESRIFSSICKNEQKTLKNENLQHYHSLTFNFNYCLYGNTSISGYTVLTASNDQLTGRDAEINFHAKFWILLWHLPGDADRRHEVCS